MEVWGNNLKHISVSNQYIPHLKLTPCCVLILHSWTWKIGIRGQATALSASGHWGKLTAACSEEHEQTPHGEQQKVCWVHTAAGQTGPPQSQEGCPPMSEGPLSPPDPVSTQDDARDRPAKGEG